MKEATQVFSLKHHFERKEPVVREIYDQLLKKLRQVGPIAEEPKETSIHLVNATALAGIATRKNSLILTVKSDRQLASERIYRSERVSANRFHHQLKLTSPAEVDPELLGWLKHAYALSA